MTRKCKSTAAYRSPSLPGIQRIASSPLLTIIGELVIPNDEPVWTASLLYVLRGLGLSEPAARQVLARAADAGWLLSERLGREVRWTTTSTAARLNVEVAGRVADLSYESAGRDQWDGTGIILHVIVPVEKSTVRKPLYNALTRAGFGSPAPGLWINPHIDRLDETSAVIDALGLREFTSAFIGKLANVGLSSSELLAQAWDLDEVAEQYTQLLAAFDTLEPEAGDEVLFAYLALVHEWRKFPAIDPRLPHALIPDWIGSRATDMYLDRSERWRPGAQTRWRQVATGAAPPRPDAALPQDLPRQRSQDRPTPDS
jgi:phenylacetic acid degradation operon negative regulatory protein